MAETAKSALLSLLFVLCVASCFRSCFGRIWTLCRTPSMAMLGSYQPSHRIHPGRDRDGQNFSSHPLVCVVLCIMSCIVSCIVFRIVLWSHSGITPHPFHGDAGTLRPHGTHAGRGRDGSKVGLLCAVDGLFLSTYRYRVIGGPFPFPGSSKHHPCAVGPAGSFSSTLIVGSVAVAATSPLVLFTMHVIKKGGPPPISWIINRSIRLSSPISSRPWGLIKSSTA